MEEAGKDGQADAKAHERLGHPLPQADQRADVRILGPARPAPGPAAPPPPAPPARAAAAPRAAPRRIGVTALLEVGYAPFGMMDHVLLGAEDQRAGGTGLDAGRLQAHRHPVRAQRAFVGLAVLLRDARDVERTAGDAIAAADAVLLVEIHDAVRILDDGARRRAGLEAARVIAVHAAVLADQPFQTSLLHLHFGEAHHGPGLVGEVARVVVEADVGADLVAQVVPFHARRLAGLAADALGDGDQLGDVNGVAHTRRRRAWN